MALRVWLPLNGDLENKGISNITVTNNGATVDNNGKIGKCYNFGTNKYLKINNYAAEFLTYNEFSLSVWFKCTAQNTSHSGSALISGGNWNQPTNLLNLALSNFSSDHYSRLLVSGSGGWANGYSYNFYLNQWYNVVLTSGDGAVRAYVNGELIGDTYAAFKPTSLEQTWICIGNGTYNQSFHFNGLMNDIRIYDHCLSAKEVKEISQGLVLHYKLDGFSGGTGENIILTNSNFSNGTTGWSNWATVQSREIVTIKNKKWAHIVKTANAYGGYSRVITIKPNTVYTVSATFYASGTTKGILWWHYRSSEGGANLSQSSKSFDLTTTPQRYSAQIPIYTNANYTVDRLNLMIGTPTETFGDVDIYFTDIKIEEGSIATSYIQSNSELGIDTTKIIDSSGYGNNGILTGILETSNDTPKYQLSSFFNGSDTAIQIPYNATIWQDNFTMNLWFKKDELGSKSYETLIGGPSGFEMDTRANNATTLSLYMASTRGGNVYSPFNFGEWYMITLVNNGTNELYYINGNLVKTIEKKSMPIGNYFIGAWQTNIKQNYKGNISDVRIYTTALSAEDILDLYHTSASIDNLGGIYGFEFVEDTSTRELLALPWTTSYTNHTKTSLWTNFNEKGEWTSNTNSSSSTDYIKINPTGKTYYWDTEVSIAAGNQFYIGFEKYDANKTSRSNNACVYVIATKPTSDIVHQRYSGVVDLATDGVNPTDTITLRILNAWSGTTSDSTKEATIHYLSLREATEKPKTGKVKQQGQIYTDEFVERKKQASIYENGFVGGNIIIEK